MPQHKWHKEIKAWADGDAIQFRYNKNDPWVDIEYPNWTAGIEYRIKPAELVMYTELHPFNKGVPLINQKGKVVDETLWTQDQRESDNIKATFIDGKLTKLEILE